MSDATHSTPRAAATPPPQPPQADPATAAWWALPLPMQPAHMRADARPHMAALTNFMAALAALEADATLPTDARLGHLDMLELALSGAFGPALSQPALHPAVVLRESLLKTGGSFQDMLALTDACRDTLTGALPASADEWRNHAARASAPVLRHFLLLHGEHDERLLGEADDLARTWFFLRLQAARAAGHAQAPSLPEGAAWEAILQWQQHTAQTWQLAADGHARTMLLRLHRLAMAVAQRLQRSALRVKPAKDAPALPPATVLADALGWPARMRIALTARLAKRR